MLAVPQNMGFLACALPIESYSLCRVLFYAEQRGMAQQEAFHFQQVVPPIDQHICGIIFTSPATSRSLASTAQGACRAFWCRPLHITPLPDRRMACRYRLELCRV